MVKILAVDVDQTVVATGEVWNRWISDYLRCPTKELYQGCPYDIREMYKEEIEGKPSYYHDNLLDFWRVEYRYHPLSPIEGSVEALRQAKEVHGFEVVFVSTIKGNHHKSKYEWLERHFPFMDGFIATKEKEYARCNIIIDDRQDVLDRMPKGVIPIRYDSPYEQLPSKWVEKNRTRLMTSWDQLGSVIYDY